MIGCSIRDRGILRWRLAGIFGYEFARSVINKDRGLLRRLNKLLDALSSAVIVILSDDSSTIVFYRGLFVIAIECECKC